MGQKEEIETIKDRQITLKLSDVDVKRLCEKSGAVGLTVSELLQNFIGDLVDGTYTNGSDERMLANQWFERCWFSIFPEYTFLRFLIDYNVVEDTIEEWNEINCFKELEEPDEDDKEDLTYYEECIDEKFEEYRGHRKDRAEEVKLDVEMKKVINWWEQYKQML